MKKKKQQTRRGLARPANGRPLKSFILTYAYDIPCYQDIKVDAVNKRAAIAEGERALEQDRFKNVTPEPVPDGPQRHRVLYLVTLTPEQAARDNTPSMAKVIESADAAAAAKGRPYVSPAPKPDPKERGLGKHVIRTSRPLNPGAK